MKKARLPDGDERPRLIGVEPGLFEVGGQLLGRGLGPVGGRDRAPLGHDLLRAHGHERHACQPRPGARAFVARVIDAPQVMERIGGRVVEHEVARRRAARLEKRQRCHQAVVVDELLGVDGGAGPAMPAISKHRLRFDLPRLRIPMIGRHGRRSRPGACRSMCFRFVPQVQPPRERVGHLLPRRCGPCPLLRRRPPDHRPAVREPHLHRHALLRRRPVGLPVEIDDWFCHRTTPGQVPQVRRLGAVEFPRAAGPFGGQRRVGHLQVGVDREHAPLVDRIALHPGRVTDRPVGNRGGAGIGPHNCRTGNIAGQRRRCGEDEQGKRES